MSTRYSASTHGHDVALEFDRSALVINRAKLLVDGELVDKTNVFYGEKDLRAELPDGTSVQVKFGSGMGGELQRPQLRNSDGGWIDMAPRS